MRINGFASSMVKLTVIITQGSPVINPKREAKRKLFFKNDYWFY